MGFYGNPSYGARKDRRRWTHPKCFGKVFHSSRQIDVLVGGSGGKGGTVGLEEDSVKRFLAGWIWTEADITCSMGSASASGSTRVLIARESYTSTYSLPTFNSSSWSLGTFSKIFMIGLLMMILCERFSGRSKMWKSWYRVGLAIRTGAALRIPRQSKDCVGVTWSRFWDEIKAPRIAEFVLGKMIWYWSPD
jgi:hypothetical protein